MGNISARNTEKYWTTTARKINSWKMEQKVSANHCSEGKAQTRGNGVGIIPNYS